MKSTAGQRNERCALEAGFFLIERPVRAQPVSGDTSNFSRGIAVTGIHSLATYTNNSTKSVGAQQTCYNADLLVGAF